MYIWKPIAHIHNTTIGIYSNCNKHEYYFHFGLLSVATTAWWSEKRCTIFFGSVLFRVFVIVIAIAIAIAADIDVYSYKTKVIISIMKLDREHRYFRIYIY